MFLCNYSWGGGSGIEKVMTAFLLREPELQHFIYFRNFYPTFPSLEWLAIVEIKHQYSILI